MGFDGVGDGRTSAAADAAAPSSALVTPAGAMDAISSARSSSCHPMSALPLATATFAVRCCSRLASASTSHITPPALCCFLCLRPRARLHVASYAMPNAAAATNVLVS